MALIPVSFTEQVVSDFLRYHLTTYPLADDDLYQQMRKLLHLEETRSTPLRQGPFISLSRPFRSGATIAKLITANVLHPGMASIACLAAEVTRAIDERPPANRSQTRRRTSGPDRGASRVCSPSSDRSPR